ncbi:MAG: Gldg family protein [Rhodospirillales bacterium]|nr:Gldg family protein [Rhodospirillales bacterium]
MADKSKSRTLLTGLGVALAAVLFVAINVLAGAGLSGTRIDLTADRLFTLSQGTRAILAKIEEPVTLRFYYSARLGREIPSYGVYAQRVREMLEEYRDAARGKLRLEVIDPQPFSDEEDRAVAFGLQAVPLNQQGESVYFGLAGTNGADREETVAFFQPERERFLEYDLTKIVYNLTVTKKPQVGLLSTLPMEGEFRGMQGPTPPWAVYTQLGQFFDIRPVAKDATAIPADIGVLMVVHPKGLSDNTLYAIDQFVLRGGRALVFVDPNAEGELARGGQQAMGMPVNSNMTKLFDAWGLSMADDKIAGDRIAARRVNAGTAGRVRAVDYVAWLTLREQNFERGDVLLAEASTLQMASAGILSPKEGATTNFQPLVRTSPQSMEIAAEAVRLQPDPEKLLNDFKPSGQPLVLAARVSGQVKSAFDKAPEPAKPAEGAQKPAEPPAAPPEYLAQSKGPINVIVVADTDMLEDRFWVSVQEFFGQRVATPSAYNGDFVVNAVDNLMGSSDLIGLRGRGLSQRPFTLLENIQREAELRYRAKERELSDKLKDAEKRLSELQGRNAPGTGPAAASDARTILSPEQQAEIEKFRGEVVVVRRDLRNVQQDLRRDIEGVQGFARMANIGAVPALVALAALVLGWLRVRGRRPQGRG